MNTTLIRLIQISCILFFFICTAYTHKLSGVLNHGVSSFRQISHQPTPKPKVGNKNTVSHTIIYQQVSDTTFTLKIENDKRVADDALKAKLSREIKAAIAKYRLNKPYKIAMGFTKGARDVETFLFGEQIFYTLAENGFTITGVPMDMPDEALNPIPQIKVVNNIIYVILSKM